MARVYERAAYEAALIAGNMPEMDEGAEKVLAAVRELAAEHRDELVACPLAVASVGVPLLHTAPTAPGTPRQKTVGQCTFFSFQ